MSRTALLLSGDEPLGHAAAERLAGFVSRRLAREPVFRIIGRRSFFGLDLAVTPAVLDPRPDTETVVTVALAAAAQRAGERLRIVDLGTGSGAILCALLDALPSATGLGVDRSPGACEVALGNLRALNLADRACVVRGNWAEAIGPSADIIVSNPPYIDTAVLATLDPEVRDHDPVLALDGGPDGFAAYRAIASALPRILDRRGTVVFEVGATQADAVDKLLREQGLGTVQRWRDLGGHERVVSARWERTGG